MTRNGDAAGTPISRVLSAKRISSANFIRITLASVLPVWKWLSRYSPKVLARGAPRRLSVAETVSFGDKGFVSIVQVDGEQFLIGGSPSNMVLLARLEPDAALVGAGLFENVLLRTDSDTIEQQAVRGRSIEVPQ